MHWTVAVSQSTFQCFVGNRISFGFSSWLGARTGFVEYCGVFLPVEELKIALVL